MKTMILALFFFLFSFTISVHAYSSNSTFNGTYNNTPDGDPINSILDIAVINNITLNTSNPAITVSPGQSLIGRMEVLERDPCSFCILPVVGVNSWDRTFFADLGTIPGDFNFHRKIFTFSFNVPTVPGDYFIAVVHAGCFAAADVVYGCYGLGDPRRGVPGGGDDVWDLKYFTSWESLLPNGNFTNGVAIKVVASAKPDLSIKDIKPVQVVFDADINNDTRIDLVKGKNTSIIVDLNITNPNLIPDNQDIDFLTSLDGIIVKLDTFKFGQIKQQGNQARIFFVPNFDGNAEIAVTVDPLNLINESNETNNLMLKNVSVKDTNNFLIVYKRVDYLGSVDKYNSTIGNGTLFINATYPVNPQKFSIDNSNPSFTPFIFPSIDSDLLFLCIEGQLQTGFNAMDVVGIVPNNYFNFYGQGNTVGITKPGRLVCSALVTQGFWTDVAHEVGHLHGLPVNPALNTNSLEEYNLTTTKTIAYPGNPATGLWIDRNLDINNGLCFMGASPSTESFVFDGTFGNRQVWVDNQDYTHLFQFFAASPRDAEGLLVTGFIFKNGTVLLGDWYSFSNGTLDTLPSGNFSIQTLDSLGNIINKTSFGVSFNVSFELAGIVETNFTPFAFKIPFLNNTSSVRIVLNNTTIVEINPSSKTLRDAINSIPSFGFINNPQQRRIALLNKIDAFEMMLKENATQGAANKLRFDIRDKVEKWIIDYTPQNVLQLSKGFILDLIDRTISRLSIIN